VHGADRGNGWWWEMRVAQLGKSGVALSRIGLGGFELGPDDDKPRRPCPCSDRRGHGVRRQLDRHVGELHRHGERVPDRRCAGRGRGRVSGVQQGGTGAGHHRRCNAAHSFAVADGLRPIADRHGATVAQVAIAWVLHQPGVSAAMWRPLPLPAIAAELDLTESLAEIDALISLGPAFAAQRP